MGIMQICERLRSGITCTCAVITLASVQRSQPFAMESLAEELFKRFKELLKKLARTLLKDTFKDTLKDLFTES